MTEAPALDQPVLGEPNLPPSPEYAAGTRRGGLRLQRRGTVERWVRTVGRAVTVRIPVFGDTVIVADPALAKQIFTTSPEVLHDIQPNLSRILGKGSVFALDGADHRRRRKLLTPPFHGKSIAAYERIVEEETMREMATWPEGKEFETLEPMMRITLNVILRAVFGADGAEMQQLRELMPQWVTLGSRLAVLPSPAPDSRWFTRPGWWSPWAKLAELPAHLRGPDRPADRKGPRRPAFRGPHRHPRGVPAGHL